MHIGKIMVSAAFLLEILSPSSAFADLNADRDALTLAVPIAAKYYHISDCKPGDPRLRYSVKGAGDIFLADIGPKKNRAKYLRITVRKRDMKIIHIDRSKA